MMRSGSFEGLGIEMNQTILPGMTPENSDGDRDCWATPQDLFNTLDVEFGFGYDMAAQPWSAKCDRFYEKHHDSLSFPWPRPMSASSADRLACWVNPPFSGLAAWSSKAMHEAAKGALVVMLLPAHRCEQPWFQDSVIGHAHEVRMIRRRVAYVPPPGLTTGSDGAKFPSMVAVWRGPNPEGKTELRSL